MTHNSTALKGSKKVLQPRLVSGKGMYEIKYNNGGEVPKKLLGLFSSEGVARKAIEQYIAGKDNK